MVVHCLPKTQHGNMNIRLQTSTEGGQYMTEIT